MVTGGFAHIHNPASPLGQLLTLLQVILGIILTGALTAGLANVLLGDDTARVQRSQLARHERMDEMTERPASIEKLLKERE